ncbi:MAG: SH3 domain-containing protein, partial [Clostridia bacterium]|nr:SH3 domain-containing protein [Clostridia bacterium]
ASAATVVPRPVQIQWTNEWLDDYYGGQNLYDTGCGVFATVNAVGYLTGNEMSVTEVAQWAYDIKALNYYAGGVDRTIMYKQLQAKFGTDYGFTVDCADGSGYWSGASSTILQNHLKSGGVAIGHVLGHFIAVVGYDASTNYFHVYDSAPSSSRGTGNGDAWVSYSWFTTSYAFSLDWFCLLTKTGTVINRDYEDIGKPLGTTADKLGTYQIATEQLNVRAGATTDYDIVTKVKQGDIVKVTQLSSSGWGKFVAPDGIEGWANVGVYAKYIGLDALAYSTASMSTGLTAVNNEDGSITLTNTGTADKGLFDLYLPHRVGTLTTPYLSLRVSKQWGEGYYFGVTQKGSGYFMMRDCNSGDQLVNETSAPYTTGSEAFEIDLAEWWTPDEGYQVDQMRFYVAPGSSIKIHYCYFAATAKTVTSEAYNVNTYTAAKNVSLMKPETLDILDRSRTGSYTYQNGVLSVTSETANGYEVVFDVNETFDVNTMKRLLLSIDSNVSFEVKLYVTHANGEGVVSLVNDFYPQFTASYPTSGFLPAWSGTAGLDLYNYYGYNNLIPSDGQSTIKRVRISLGYIGTATFKAIQIAPNDTIVEFTDTVVKSDSSTAAVEPEPPVDPGVIGDVNGDGVATTVDARLIVSYLIGTGTLTAEQLALADFNNSGDVSTTDVREMLVSLIG